MEEKSKRVLSPAPLLCPVPVVVVTCGDIDAEKNAITLAWVGVASSEPPCVTIGVRPTRYSFGLIQRYGDFVINVPGADQVEAVKYCGSVSGRNEDKFKGAALTPIPAERVRAPLIKEFPLNLECKVKSRISLGSHDLFIGEIVEVHANSDILTAGEIDLAKLQAVTYFRGKYYPLGGPADK
ncbi:MAG TPA: flavin reductase family protein [Firmicutes bacterium]|nr:flavin reductase family protein [Candidatus Fermentithermobacillaceae bacterium]